MRLTARILPPSHKRQKLLHIWPSHLTLGRFMARLAHFDDEDLLTMELSSRQKPLPVAIDPWSQSDKSPLRPVQEVSSMTGSCKANGPKPKL